MTVSFLILVAAVAVLAWWWTRQRAARIRQEAEAREARMLEALFVARRAGTGNGGENIDVDKIFGREQGAKTNPSSADAVLRAAGLEADVIALVKSPPARRPDPEELLQHDTTAIRPQASLTQPRAHPEHAAMPAREAAAAAADADEPVPVRDLVQIFYEARGYRVVPAARTARPIELVLRHKTDPLRSYAFAPLAEPVSEATARLMIERAKRIDQSRVLITTEGAVAPELAKAMLAEGVRIYDNAAIEAHLTQLDFPTAAKIRAVARRRAARRAQATLG